MNILYLIRSLSNLFINATPEGRLINLLIAIIFIVGVSLITYRLYQLTREQDGLMLTKKVAGSRQAADWEAVIKSANTNKLNDTLAIRRLCEVYNNGCLSEERIFAMRDFAEARMQLYTEWPRHLAAMAIFFGLLGTVWGLASAVGGLHQQLQNMTTVDQLPALMEAMGHTLSGMRTAFSCTATGLLCMLLLSVFNLAFSNGQTKFLMELDEFTALELLPKKEETAEDAAQIFARSLTEGSQQLNTVVANLSTAMDGISARLRDTADRFSRDLTQAAVSMQEGSKTMTGLAAVFCEAEQTLNQYRQEISVVYNDIAAMLKQMSQEHGERMSRTDESLSQIDVYQNKVADMIRRITETQDLAASALTAADELLKSGPQAFRDELTGLSDTFAERASSLTDGLMTALQQSLMEQRAIYEALAELAGASKQLNQSVAELATRPAEVPQIDLSALNKITESFSAISHKSLLAMQSLITRLEETLRSSPRKSATLLGVENSQFPPQGSENPLYETNYISDALSDRAPAKSVDYSAFKPSPPQITERGIMRRFLRRLGIGSSVSWRRPR
jgi:biopolymer transport protein ExbB/TolQ